LLRVAERANDDVAVHQAAVFHSAAGSPEDEARAELTRIMASEYVDAIFQLFAEGTYDDSRVLPTVHQVTGDRPRTYEQWVSAHASQMR
jgi:hypothetical protein